MPKIRKQPRRSTKKHIDKTLKNPFFNTSIPSFVPNLIAQNFVAIEKISFRQLDEFVQSYNLLNDQLDRVDFNVKNMKEAVLQQQLKIQQLKAIITNFKQFSQQQQGIILQADHLMLKKNNSKLSKDLKNNQKTIKNQKFIKKPKLMVNYHQRQELDMKGVSKNEQNSEMDSDNEELMNNQIQKSYENFENPQYVEDSSYIYGNKKDVWGDHNQRQIPVDIEHEDSQEHLLQFPLRLDEENQQYLIK